MYVWVLGVVAVACWVTQRSSELGSTCAAAGTLARRCGTAPQSAPAAPAAPQKGTPRDGAAPRRSTMHSGERLAFKPCVLAWLQPPRPCEAMRTSPGKQAVPQPHPTLSRHSGCSSRNFSNASSFCGKRGKEWEDRRGRVGGGRGGRRLRCAAAFEGRWSLKKSKRAQGGGLGRKHGAPAGCP